MGRRSRVRGSHCELLLRMHQSPVRGVLVCNAEYSFRGILCLGHVLDHHYGVDYGAHCAHSCKNVRAEPYSRRNSTSRVGRAQLDDVAAGVIADGVKAAHAWWCKIKHAE